MLVSESCIACILNQVERVAKIHRMGRSETLSLIREVVKFLGDKNWDVPPPVLAEGVYRIISEFLGKEDPYAEIKEFYTKSLLKIYEDLVARVKASSNPLKTALLLSAVGNSIDFGAEEKHELRVEDVFKYMEEASFSKDQTEEFFKELEASKSLVVIGDNAGETVLDRVFMEILLDVLPGVRIFYITRGRPVINDATKLDAEMAGIDKVAEIVSDGNGIPGFVPERASSKAKELFYGPSTILSKGQGNFETLSHVDRKVYMAFKVKCEPVARHLGLTKGSYVFIKNGSPQ